MCANDLDWKWDGPNWIMKVPHLCRHSRKQCLRKICMPEAVHPLPATWLLMLVLEGNLGLPAPSGVLDKPIKKIQLAILALIRRLQCEKTRSRLVTLNSGSFSKSLLVLLWWLNTRSPLQLKCRVLSAPLSPFTGGHPVMISFGVLG